MCLYNRRKFFRYKKKTACCLFYSSSTSYFYSNDRPVMLNSLERHIQSFFISNSFKYTHLNLVLADNTLLFK